MNPLKLFFVLLVIFIANLAMAQAPSWTPGFYRVDQANHYGVTGTNLAVGDRIWASSFTFVNNIDLGGQQQLLRTVDYHGTNGYFNPGAADVMTSLITTSGVDSFTVVFPLDGGQSGHWWYAQVHYRYLVDPDGNGPIEAGEDAFASDPIVASPIQALPYTNTHVSYLAEPDGCNCHTVSFTIALDHHYDHSDAHEVDLLTEIVEQSTGTVVVSFFDDISDPGGNDVVTVDHSAYLIAGPGTYCIRATLWYSHQWAGHSNYQDVLVDQTDGTNCFYYDGFSTHVEASGGQAHTLSAYPNPTTDFIHVDGVDSGHVVTISDMSGRAVSQATHTISGTYTFDASRFAAGMYTVRDDTGGFARFEKY